MHGQGLSVPVGKTEMRGIHLPSLMNPAVCYKTPIVGGVEIWLASARFILGFAPTVPGTSRVNRKYDPPFSQGKFQLDENEMVVRWKARLHIAKTPGMSADPFFLFILSNIMGRPIVMHGQGLSVPVGKTEMRGIYLPSLMNPTMCCKTPIVGGGRNLAS